MDLENRLAMAQILNDLIKRESLIKFGNKKSDEKLEQEVEVFVKKNLHNLLLSIMGERTDTAFSEEEVVILKAMAFKLKTSSIGAKA
jgi:hypothetical protein